MSIFSVQLIPVAGVVGVVTSTAFASTSLTISSVTASALLLLPNSRENRPPKERDSSQSPEHLARQWKVLEDLAHNVSISALVVGTSSFIYAGLASSASATLQKRLFFIGAAFNFLTIPYTLVFMLRKNTELAKRADSGEKIEPGHTDTRDLMQNVAVLGKFRGSLPLVSAVAGALALVI